MEKYEVKFLEPALDDLDEIVLYIAKDSRNSALKMHDEIIMQVKKLESFPKAGRLVPDKKISTLGFRMLSVSSYIIFYRIIDYDVFIYRVIHGARNYPMLFNEL